MARIVRCAGGVVWWVACCVGGVVCGWLGGWVVCCAGGVLCRWCGVQVVWWVSGVVCGWCGGWVAGGVGRVGLFRTTGDGGGLVHW